MSRPSGHPPRSWWKNRRRGRHQKRGPVGTEAAALAAIEKNSKNFDYPPQGFATRIEHSLLYAMISEPNTYPEDVVMKEIAEEDFPAYLVVAQGSGMGMGMGTSSSLKDEEPTISYAQFSAIMALSAEKNTNAPTQRSDGPQGGQEGGQQQQQQRQPSVSQKLCKTLLQCVVRYATEHGLDREAEVQELLRPVERHAAKRGEKAALKQILPFYVGYTASILTGNPVPMLVGAAFLSTAPDGVEEERKNVQAFASETSRAADVEKTGLLDEADDL